eukprot:4544772-Alexandrium_andersonii.AAC.1
MPRAGVGDEAGEEGFGEGAGGRAETLEMGPTSLPGGGPEGANSPVGGGRTSRKRFLRSASAESSCRESPRASTTATSASTTSGTVDSI